MRPAQTRKGCLEVRLYFFEIGLLGRIHDQEKIDDGPDAESAAGEEFAYTQAGLAKQEAVYAERAGEERYDEHHRRVSHLDGGDTEYLVIIRILKGLAEDFSIDRAEFLGVLEEVELGLIHGVGFVFQTYTRQRQNKTRLPY